MTVEAARLAHDEEVDLWFTHLITYCSSTNRLDKFLEMSAGISSNRSNFFWSVFSQIWSICDDTWEHRNQLRKEFLRFSGSGGFEGAVKHGSREEPLLSIDKYQFPLTVYRGCSVVRKRGFSWTTDRKVAEGFARGHRSIKVPYAGIASCTINRKIVLARMDDRGEHEVLLDYRRLPRLEFESLIVASNKVSHLA